MDEICVFLFLWSPILLYSVSNANTSQMIFMSPFCLFYFVIWWRKQLCSLGKTKWTTVWLLVGMSAHAQHVSIRATGLFCKQRLFTSCQLCTDKRKNLTWPTNTWNTPLRYDTFVTSESLDNLCIHESPLATFVGKRNHNGCFSKRENKSIMIWRRNYNALSAFNRNYIGFLNTTRGFLLEEIDIKDKIALDLYMRIYMYIYICMRKFPLHPLSPAESEKVWRDVRGLDYARAEYKCHKFVAMVLCWFPSASFVPNQKGRRRWIKKI